MTKPNIERMAKRVHARRHGGHSAAYRWLRENHERIKQILATDGPTWPIMAEVVLAEGITGARGQVMTDHALRRMWKRVCRDVEIAEAEKRTGIPARKRRQQVPATWQPERADSSSGRSVAPIDPEESSLVGLRRIMAERSGR